MTTDHRPLRTDDITDRADRRLLPALLLALALGACATPGDESGPARESRSPGTTSASGSAAAGGSGGSAAAGSPSGKPAPGATAAGSGAGAGASSTADPRDKDLPTETVRPSGKADWVAVYESQPGARYADQRVIYVDRANVQTGRIEQLTYYLARTREVSRSATRAKVQELAVICEGTPIAPATALRGEGTEDGNGNISMKRAPGALTSVSQFSTQRVRIDANNPNTFIVRAICRLGTEK